MAWEHSQDQMDVENNYDYFWETDLSATTASLSDHVHSPAIGLDSNEPYLILHLRSLGRLLIPHIGDFQLDYLLFQTMDAFFSWYSSQTGDTHVSALRFNLMELISGPDKYINVTLNSPDTFISLQKIIGDTFLALREENPSLSIFRVEITQPRDDVGIYETPNRRQIPWMRGSLIL